MRGIERRGTRTNHYDFIGTHASLSLDARRALATADITRNQHHLLRLWKYTPILMNDMFRRPPLIFFYCQRLEGPAYESSLLFTHVNRSGLKLKSSVHPSSHYSTGPFPILAVIFERITRNRDDVERSHHSLRAVCTYQCTASVRLCSLERPASGSFGQPWRKPVPSSSSDYRRSKYPGIPWFQNDHS